MLFNLFAQKHHFIKFNILIYSAIIAGKLKVDDEIYLRLFELIKDDYKNYTNKIIKTTKERVSRARKETCGIDYLLKEIVFFLKTKVELKDNINYAKLQKLIDEDDVVSLRVFDFLVEEVKEIERKKLF